MQKAALASRKMGEGSPTRLRPLTQAARRFLASSNLPAFSRNSSSENSFNAKPERSETEPSLAQAAVSRGSGRRRTRRRVGSGGTWARLGRCGSKMLIAAVDLTTPLVSLFDHVCERLPRLPRGRVDEEREGRGARPGPHPIAPRTVTWPGGRRCRAHRTRRHPGSCREPLPCRWQGRPCRGCRPPSERPRSGRTAW